MTSANEQELETLISKLSAQYPGRETQIRNLTTLLSGRFPLPKNLVVHGLEATGKTEITNSVLEALSERQTDDETPTLQYATVTSAEAITGRQLLENAIAVIEATLGIELASIRCENLAQLVVHLEKILKTGTGKKSERNFVLVFDGIDQQRDAPPSLVSGLARLAEIVPNLTTIFIVTSSRPHMLHHSGVVHIQFPQYTKSEALSILALDVPPIVRSNPDSMEEDAVQYKKDVKDLWTKFCGVVWDSLTKHADRDIVSFRAASKKLWPLFIEPVVEGNLTPKDFSRLLVAKRTIFQDEKVLIPNIVSSSSIASGAATPQRVSTSLGTQLPIISRFLLVAAYLASYNPTRADHLFFSKSSDRRKRKRKSNMAPGSTTTVNGQVTARNRKISRKLLGAQAFVLERMLAIFHALLADAGRGALPGGRYGGSTADVQTGIATLASLRLLIKTSAAADPVDGSAKWRANVGWEMIRTVARSVNIEVEELLME